MGDIMWMELCVCRQWTSRTRSSSEIGRLTADAFAALLPEPVDEIGPDGCWHTLVEDGLYDGPAVTYVRQRTLATLMSLSRDG